MYDPVNGVKNIRRVLSESISLQDLDTLRKQCVNRPELWVLRAVIGADLPTPMTFDMLRTYLEKTGKGSFSVKDLENIFFTQVNLL